MAYRFGMIQQEFEAKVYKLETIVYENKLWTKYPMFMTGTVQEIN